MEEILLMRQKLKDWRELGVKGAQKILKRYREMEIDKRTLKKLRISKTLVWLTQNIPQDE